MSRQADQDAFCGRGKISWRRLCGPKAQPFAQPRATPWGTEAILPILSAQRANRSPNDWPVGPKISCDWAQFSPGRCPGLGELSPFGAESEPLRDRKGTAEKSCHTPSTWQIDTPLLRCENAVKARWAWAVEYLLEGGRSCHERSLSLSFRPTSACCGILADGSRSRRCASPSRQPRARTSRAAEHRTRGVFAQTARGGLRCSGISTSMTH